MDDGTLTTPCHSTCRRTLSPKVSVVSICVSVATIVRELTLITIGSTSASTEEKKSEAAATSVEVILRLLILMGELVCKEG